MVLKMKTQRDPSTMIGSTTEAICLSKQEQVADTWKDKWHPGKTGTCDHATTPNNVQPSEGLLTGAGDGSPNSMGQTARIQYAPTSQSEQLTETRPSVKHPTPNKSLQYLTDLIAFCIGFPSFWLSLPFMLWNATMGNYLLTLASLPDCLYYFSDKGNSTTAPKHAESETGLLSPTKRETKELNKAEDADVKRQEEPVDETWRQEDAPNSHIMAARTDGLEPDTPGLQPPTINTGASLAEIENISQLQTPTTETPPQPLKEENQFPLLPPSSFLATPAAQHQETGLNPSTSLATSVSRAEVHEEQDHQRRGHLNLSHSPPITDIGPSTTVRLEQEDTQGTDCTIFIYGSTESLSPEYEPEFEPEFLEPSLESNETNAVGARQDTNGAEMEADVKDQDLTAPNLDVSTLEQPGDDGITITGRIGRYCKGSWDKLRCRGLSRAYLTYIIYLLTIVCVWLPCPWFIQLGLVQFRMQCLFYDIACKRPRKKITTTIFRNLKPGDVIAFNRLLGLYDHQGVVLKGVTADSDCVTLAHYHSSEYGRKGKVVEEEFKVDQLKNDYLVDYKETYPDSETLRQRILVKEDEDYHVVCNNCHHFSEYCRTGKQQPRDTSSFGVFLLLQTASTSYTIWRLLRE